MIEIVGSDAEKRECDVSNEEKDRESGKGYTSSPLFMLLRAIIIPLRVRVKDNSSY